VTFVVEIIQMGIVLIWSRKKKNCNMSITNQGKVNSYPNNFLQGLRGNQSKGYGWRNEAGPSHRQPLYHHQQNQPSTNQRMTKLEDTLEMFYASLFDKPEKY
jgi:hypothetical protein